MTSLSAFDLLCVQIDDWSMVNFLPLDIADEESIQYVLSHIDNSIQYGEDADVKIRDHELGDDDDAPD